jgi:hypothetical protein
MKSLLPIFVSLVGFFILILLYYVFIYQKPETPFDVFLRLIRHNQETILAFTYKKIGPDKYLNYYVNEGQLEPRNEDYPVNYDGIPVQNQQYHGLVSDTHNGFIVSGIEFPFRCPGGWTYKDGKCHLEEICQPSDINVFKGINYYQFNETLNKRANSAFHPRLFMDCNTNERKHCAINELYVGGESLPNTYQPCEPYDMCQDMLTMTTHNYPIRLGDSLGPNQFYICQNGVSVLRTCPENTQFSRTHNGCMPVSRCFDRPDNTTIYTGDSNQFVLCLNGEENVVRCGNGVFQGNQQVECRNSICVNPRVIFNRFNNRINIPVGQQFCPGGTNTPEQFLCEIIITNHKDNVQHLINDADAFPTIREPHDRFEAFGIPDKSFDANTSMCVPFEFDTNFVEMGTHNDLLPQVPINLKTLEIDYSGTETFYYKNYNKIMQHPENTIIIPGTKKYANFTTTSNLAAFEYVESVKTATGGNDGVNYLINGPMNKGLLSTETMYKNPAGEYGPEGLAWNAYTNTFTLIDEAHSPMARSFLGMDFSSTTYTFKYVIFSNMTKLHTLTPYGMCTFAIELLEGVSLDGLLLQVDGFPTYASMDLALAGPNNTMVVTDIYDKQYNPKHRPYFLDYIKILALESPLAGLNIPISQFFEVDSRPLFKEDTLFT